MHNHNGRPPSPALKAAAKMPLLDHYHRGEPFDISRSDVVRWLCDQPEIQQALFNYYKRNGLIVYVDGKWMGAETYAKQGHTAPKEPPPMSSRSRIEAAIRVR
jgi:hypothetical protein